MIWLLLYVLIGTVIGLAATVKGGGKVGFSSYMFCLMAWPLILAIAIVSSLKKRGRKG